MSFLAPHPVPGLVQGVLPPVLLAVLFLFLPFILRGMSDTAMSIEFSIELAIQVWPGMNASRGIR